MTKILIVDDEPENVEPLEACLKKSKVSFDSVSSLEDAAERLRKRTQNPYLAVILDNHFCDSSCIYTNGIVDGVDFANIVKGNRAVFTPVYEQFIADYFGKKYERIVEAYACKPVILFSGSAATERLNRPDMFDGFDVVVKMADHLRGSPCEEDIVDILSDEGIRLKTFNFADYKIKHNLTGGVR